LEWFLLQPKILKIFLARLIDRLPPNATWDDLKREINVREAIERGLADSKAGRTKDVKEIRAKYGLPE
jgi:predicted transcriptional regulator